MDKKELFKEFVKKNPCLVKYVKDNEMTWQKFYEIYDLYGESDPIWNDYQNEKKETKVNSKSDVLSFLKGINLDNVSEGIQNLQRVLGVLGDIESNNKESNSKKPRPLYKHFDD